MGHITRAARVNRGPASRPQAAGDTCGELHESGDKLVDGVEPVLRVFLEAPGDGRAQGGGVLPYLFGRLRHGPFQVHAQDLQATLSEARLVAAAPYSAV